jgi:hypothetical protein
VVLPPLPGASARAALTTWLTVAEEACVLASPEQEAVIVCVPAVVREVVVYAADPPLKANRAPVWPRNPSREQQGDPSNPSSKEGYISHYSKSKGDLDSSARGRGQLNALL